MLEEDPDASALFGDQVPATVVVEIEDLDRQRLASTLERSADGRKTSFSITDVNAHARLQREHEVERAVVVDVREPQRAGQ